MDTRLITWFRDNAAGREGRMLSMHNPDMQEARKAAESLKETDLAKDVDALKKNAQERSDAEKAQVKDAIRSVERLVQDRFNKMDPAKRTDPNVRQAFQNRVNELLLMYKLKAEVDPAGSVVVSLLPAPAERPADASESDPAMTESKRITNAIRMHLAALQKPGATVDEKIAAGLGILAAAGELMSALTNGTLSKTQMELGKATAKNTPAAAPGTAPAETSAPQKAASGLRAEAKKEGKSLHGLRDTKMAEKEKLQTELKTQDRNKLAGASATKGRLESEVKVLEQSTDEEDKRVLKDKQDELKKAITEVDALQKIVTEKQAAIKTLERQVKELDGMKTEAEDTKRNIDLFLKETRQLITQRDGVTPQAGMEDLWDLLKVNTLLTDDYDVQLQLDDAAMAKLRHLARDKGMQPDDKTLGINAEGKVVDMAVFTLTILRLRTVPAAEVAPAPRLRVPAPNTPPAAPAPPVGTPPVAPAPPSAPAQSRPNTDLPSPEPSPPGPIAVPVPPSAPPAAAPPSPEVAPAPRAGEVPPATPATPPSRAGSTPAPAPETAPLPRQSVPPSAPAPRIITPSAEARSAEAVPVSSRAPEVAPVPRRTPPQARDVDILFVPDSAYEAAIRDLPRRLTFTDDRAADRLEHFARLNALYPVTESALLRVEKTSPSDLPEAARRVSLAADEERRLLDDLLRFNTPEYVTSPGALAPFQQRLQRVTSLVSAWAKLSTWLTYRGAATKRLMESNLHYNEIQGAPTATGIRRAVWSVDWLQQEAAMLNEIVRTPGLLALYPANVRAHIQQRLQNEGFQKDWEEALQNRDGTMPNIYVPSPLEVGVVRGSDYVLDDRYQRKLASEATYKEWEKINEANLRYATGMKIEMPPKTQVNAIEIKLNGGSPIRFNVGTNAPNRLYGPHGITIIRAPGQNGYNVYVSQRGRFSLIVVADRHRLSYGDIQGPNRDLTPPTARPGDIT